MVLKVNELAPVFELPNIDGTLYQLTPNKGKLTLIAFHRFAGCPLCNLRIHDLILQYPKWQSQLDIVVIFDSSMNNLRSHMQRHDVPFTVLADEKNTVYQQYHIQHSYIGVMLGMVKRMPQMFRSLKQGYIPKSMEGSMTTMPASFILDEKGIVVCSYYGKDEGDYLPFEQIEVFLK